MSHTSIIANFVIRSLAWGIVLGAVVGILFQLAFLGPVAYGLFGIILGIVAGSVLGIVNGLVLAVSTLQFPNPLNDVDAYKKSLSKASVGFTLVGSGIIFFVLVWLLTNSTIFALFIALAASIFASLAAFYACQRVSAWYINSLASSPD